MFDQVAMFRLYFREHLPFEKKENPASKQSVSFSFHIFAKCRVGKQQTTKLPHLDSICHQHFAENRCLSKYSCNWKTTEYGQVTFQQRRPTRQSVPRACIDLDV